jgi:hypothetical protein
VNGLAAKGGFQCGQTAKARKGPPCAVTPKGTKPPSTLVFSQAEHKRLHTDYHPVKAVASCFHSPHLFHISNEWPQFLLSPEFARNSRTRRNRNQLVPTDVKLYGREK